MIETSTRKAQTGSDVFGFKVREFVEDFLRREARSKQVEDINDPNPHPPDTGTPSTLGRIDGDSVGYVRHEILRVEVEG